LNVTQMRALTEEPPVVSIETENPSLAIFDLLFVRYSSQRT